MQHNQSQGRPTILLVPIQSFNAYRENPRLVLDRARPCPRCLRELSRHDSYLRWVFLKGERFRIPVFRLRCRPCHLTVSLLPDLLVPYHRYAAEVMEEALDHHLTTGRSCRETAIAVAQPELPQDQSRTDALLSVSLKPSHQRVHAWTTRLHAMALAHAVAWLAWLLILKPETDLLHHLALPHASSAALLVHMVAALSEGGGWMAPLNRFVLHVGGQVPWRAPPLPQST